MNHLPRVWKIIFEGESPGIADDFELDFQDIRDILKGEFIGLKPEVLDIIKEKISSEENYHATGNIKEIISPEGEEISKDQFIALLGIDKKGLKFGFLLAFTSEGILVVAVWPKGYADAIKSNEKLLGGVIYYLVDRPANWERVDVILPIKK